MTVTVRKASYGNKAPVVSAGPNKEISWPQNSVILTGSASDDGIPAGSTLSVWWEASSENQAARKTAPFVDRAKWRNVTGTPPA